jgi:RNA 2',3'-cyclic 3'-phosphodiesterase
MTARLITRRLFFALWPDEPVRAALEHAARKAVRGSGGRPLPVSNWHVTLAFLGSVEEGRMSMVVEAAASVPIAPFRMAFDRIEYWQRAAVLCIVASRPPAVAIELAKSLYEALRQREFTPDPKPWRAHVTVARKVAKPHVLGALDPVEWQVDGFALVESETLPEGARHTVLQRWPRSPTS